MQRQIVQHMRTAVVTLLALVLWVTVVVAGALFGWWREPVAPTGDPQAFTRVAIALIEQTNRGNTAFLLIEDGAISAEYTQPPPTGSIVTPCSPRPR